MATLYELSEQAEYLLLLLESGEIDDKIFNDTLEAMGVNEKIENCCKFIKQLNADINMFDSEIKRLTERKATVKNSIERIKKSLLLFMDSSNQTNINTDLFTVYQRHSKEVEITDINKLPEQVLIIQPAKPDKKLIKQLIGEGVPVNGAQLKENRSVIIK